MAASVARARGCVRAGAVRGGAVLRLLSLALLLGAYLLGLLGLATSASSSSQASMIDTAAPSYPSYSGRLADGGTPPSRSLAGANGEPHARVAFVCSEFAGIVPNGGIGTFYTALAETLAAAGADVHLLYTQGARSQHQDPSKDYAYWKRHYALSNITLHALPEHRPNGVGWHAGTAYAAYDWLRNHELNEKPFDAVHFADWQGHGYFTLLAKHQQLAFQTTDIVLMIHGPLQWARHSNGQTLDNLEDLEVDFLESQSIRITPRLNSPSRYLLSWVSGNGWAMPPHNRVYVQPYTMPNAARELLRELDQTNGAGVTANQRHVDARQLTFFGRLEVRKGIETFCDALDRIFGENAAAAPVAVRRADGTTAMLDTSKLANLLRARDFAVSFLGSDRNDVRGENGGVFARRRSAAWTGVATQVVTDKDQRGALTYLRDADARRLAVLPSLHENSPLSILELIGARVPFVASDAGGIPELILREDHADAVFRAGDVDSLLDRLVRALVPRRLWPTIEMTTTTTTLPLTPPQSSDGTDDRSARLVRAALDLDEVERGWINWHGDVAVKNAQVRLSASTAAKQHAAAHIAACLCIPRDSAVNDVLASLTSLARSDRVGAVIVTAAAPEDDSVEALPKAVHFGLATVFVYDASGGVAQPPATDLESFSRDGIHVLVAAAVSDCGAVQHLCAKDVAQELDVRPPAAANRDDRSMLPSTQHALLLPAGAYLESHAISSLVAAAHRPIGASGEERRGSQNDHAGHGPAAPASMTIATGFAMSYSSNDLGADHGLRRWESVPDRDRTFTAFLGSSTSLGAIRNAIGGPVNLVGAPLLAFLATANVVPVDFSGANQVLDAHRIWRMHAEAASLDQRVDGEDEMDMFWQKARSELVPDTLYWCPASQLVGTQRTRRADQGARFASEPLLDTVRRQATAHVDATEVAVAKAVDDVAMAYAGSAEILVSSTNYERKRRINRWVSHLATTSSSSTVATSRHEDL